MSLSLPELERAYRERQQAQGEPLVILAMQLLESDVRTLRPYLAERHLSVSEYVRALIIENKRRCIDAAA